MLNQESIEVSAIDIQEHLKRCARKKISIAEYARTHNIPAHRLYEARKKQNFSKRSPAKPSVDSPRVPEFIEVPLSMSVPGISIALAGGMEIRLPQSLTPIELAALIKALRQ